MTKDEAFLNHPYPLYAALCQLTLSMKTIIQIHKHGKYYVAVDLITNVADQGLTEAAAVANLKQGLEEHYQCLRELAPKMLTTSFDP